MGGDWRGGRRDNARDLSLKRFASARVEPERARGLKADHPAVREGRTLFPSTVSDPWASPRLLVSGANSSKLGAEVRKGPWAGLPIYQLTLEERATCPASCARWLDCYGNAMHMARRHDHRDPAFPDLLRAELWLLARTHARTGFVVRLHTLGDFYSVEYVRFWAQAVDEVPGLRVFGYTACRPDAEDPRERAIGEAIQRLTEAAWDVFAIRFSGRAGAQSTIVVDRDPVRPDVIVCPAQTGGTEACGTCGLCWAEPARSKTIAFLRHGMKSTTGDRREPPAQRPREIRTTQKSRAGWREKQAARRAAQAEEAIHGNSAEDGRPDGAAPDSDGGGRERSIDAQPSRSLGHARADAGGREGAPAPAGGRGGDRRLGGVAGTGLPAAAGDAPGASAEGSNGGSAQRSVAAAKPDLKPSQPERGAAWKKAQADARRIAEQRRPLPATSKDEDRRLIEEALASGRVSVTRCPPGWAIGAEPAGMANPAYRRIGRGI